MLPWLYQPQYKPLLVNFIPKTRKSMTTTSQLKLDRHKNVVELNQLMGSQWKPPLLMPRSQADEHWNRCKQTVRFSPTQNKSLNTCSFLIYLQKQLWVAIMACCTCTCMYIFEWVSDYCFKAKMRNISATCTWW